MSDTTDPDAIRARTFSTSRRGFERAEVEAFLGEVASLVAELQERLATTDERLTQLGITDLPDLKAEIDTVGEDVREILQAARDAAEDIRDRARADAAARLGEAQAQAESMRGDAWETSEEMLRQVAGAAEELSAKASEDILFVRAEAEREALRMTGDARRDAEELLLSAQQESENLLAEARAEAESLVDSATQSADLAQESARALEQRREELMAELEDARGELSELEETIEGKRGELTHATTDPSESSVRILTEEVKPDIGDWLDEDATVRLVPLPPLPLGPVDADELVAEVESLRAPQPAEPLTGGSGSSAEVASLDFEITSGELPVAADSSATAEMFVDATPEEAVDLAAATAEPPSEPEQAPADRIEEPAAEPTEGAAETVAEAETNTAAEAEADAETDSAAETEAEDPGLADLFARLRSPGPSNEVEPTAPVDSVEPEVAAESEPAPGAVATAIAVVPAPLELDPWDLRDRMLVSVTNEVLRGIKRQIVEVQNLVLEELRTEAGEWRPKKAMFDRVLGADADGIAQLAYEAGVGAAGELAERPAPDLPVVATHSLASLVTDLWEAVVDAIDGTADGSGRERGASVGRIFRAWRTDEAERRVRQVAHAEYNAGVAAGLDALGVAHAMQPVGRDIADPDAAVIPTV